MALPFHTKNHLLQYGLLSFLFLALTACDKDDASINVKQKETLNTNTKLVSDTKVDLANKNSVNTKEETIEEISWDKLIPADYNPQEAIGEYTEQLAKLQDDDIEAAVIYGKIQAELDNAPVNMALDGKVIKIPGFVAPLENDNGVINEFLLVPYFGACIHTPPPPMNQTVMIKAKKGQGVKSEDSYLPVWVTGTLKAVEERTNIGAAGYRIENAVVEPYEDE